MTSNADSDLNNYNYKKLAQIEAAISVDLSYEPKSFENLLNLNQNFDINYRIPETGFIKSNRSDTIGTTLLNMTHDMLQTDMFKNLINRGADFTSLNDNECTVVHDSIGNNFEKLFKTRKFEGCFEDDEFAEIALDAHVHYNISKNPCNSYGFSHFHIACMMNNTKAVEYFLKNKTPVDQAVNKESPDLPGFTALHFAAKYSSYETAQLLLKYGADINLKDGRGMSAFHVVVEERLKTWPVILRYTMKPDSTWSKDDINKYFDNNEKILKLFLEKDNTCVSTFKDDIGFSSLQAACTLQDSSLVKQILSESKVNINDQVKLDSPFWPGYTALHFAAHINSETFQFLLEQGADMGIRNAHGTSPFDICLLSFKVSDIHNILSHHPTWKNILFSDGKTKLLDFIFAMLGIVPFHSFLDENVTNIDMFVPLDSPIFTGYTPLHLAVIFREKSPKYNESQDAGNSIEGFDSYSMTEASLYVLRIIKCLNLGADVTAQDARGSTTLHWAFRLQETSLVRLLFNHHQQFANPVNVDGLSHLHIACADKNELMVLKLVLLNRGDVNARVKAAYSWQSGYFRSIAKSGSTPLHFAVDCPKITEILLHCGVDVLAMDDEGFNPLERVLGRLAKNSHGEYEKEKKKILQLLIRRLTDMLVDSTNVPEKLLRCYRLLRSNFLMSMLDSDDKARDEILNKLGVTSLHLACIRNDVDGVRESLRQGIDVDARVHRKSPKWSGLTPLFCYLGGRNLRGDESDDDFSVPKLLLESGADVMKTSYGDTAVHMAFDVLCCRQMPYRLEVPKKAHNIDRVLVKLLLSHHKDFSVNPKTTSGLSHFHIACACNDVKMVEGLLENGADVNEKIDYFCEKYGGNTPLHLAAIYRSTETVDLLLKCGADVRSTNNYGSTPLHVAAKTYSKDVKILKALLHAGADVNVENIIGATPMELLLWYTAFTKDEVDIFLKNDFHAHVINPVTEEGCLAIALRKNQSFDFVYEMIVGSMDVKQLDKMNRNTIHNVVSLNRPNVSQIDYDVVEEPFTPVEDYTEAIRKLMKMSVNIDQQDRHGKTPLHYAAQMQNLTAILALLNNGADINLKDESGKTAFAYSAECTDDDYSVIDERIMQIFVSHLYKMSLVNLDVDVSVKKLEKRSKISIANVEESLEELRKLRRVRIKSCSVRLKHFLCETGAIVNLARLPLEERRAVDKLFGNVDYLSRKYPEFVGILILQFRKALGREKLISPALVSLNVLMGFNVPLVCSDIILQFLSNNSLKNLIVAADEN